MQKHFLIVVHGIGEHTSQSVTSEVVNALSKIYPNFSDEVETRAITYNHIFQRWLETASQDWQGAINSLSSVNHFSGAKDFLTRLVNTDDQNFVKTHLFDAVLYMSTLGVRVQLEVAQQLSDVLEEYIAGGNTSNRRIILMGHSLGTAVLHDTLHKMFRGGFEKDRLNQLSNMPFTFNSLYQVANTSRLFKTFVDPTTIETSVRPAPTGMIDRMYNVLNTYDPVPHLKRFQVDPASWIPESRWPRSVYREIELQAINSADIHSLDHYLSDPRLYLTLLFDLLDDYNPGDEEKKIKDYDAKAKGKRKQQIKDKLDKKVQKAKEKIPDSTREIIEALLDAIKEN